ncbi:hypothetical protein K466DRAFT_589891 [Polyporus arcularius HHB13444]|uniref:RNI-like protein n=1 Tax=Polyporus arcularius HHB13444 TaxID=1314778 RepID=A0A5C3P0S7_9APHY|nr:hypothetical protein K466DRAFT_589891 [Polyporus arcularius HHB13444]
MLAMHQVLFTQELLEAIFGQLATGMIHPDDTPEDVKWRAEVRCTLARAARVCHTFCDPALDVLWCALDSIVPLLRLIPGLEQQEARWFLTLPIADEPWTRLEVHARRVRGLCHYRTTTFFPATWSTLLSRCQGNLLPRLRVLDINELPLSDFPFLLLTLTSSLSELYLSFENDPGSALPQVAQMLLLTIVHAAPDLTILYLDEHFPVPSESVPSLGRLSRLKELKLCDPEITVNAHGLRAISQLPSLRVLSIEDLRLFGAQVELGEGLQSLETLYLHGNPNDLRIFVQASRLSVLKHLDVMVHCEDGVFPAESFGAVVSSLPQTVHKVRMGFCDGESTNPPACSLTDILQLLQPLKELSQITFDNGMRRVTASDADTKVLIDQWPRLHRFALDEDKPNPRQHSPPHPTFATLQDIALRCPELESFSTTYLDATHLPATADLPSTRHPLNSLAFDYFLGDTSPESIAQVVDLLFPSLEVSHKATVTASESPSRPGTRPWSLVLDALKTLRDNGTRSSAT